jgi:cytochrome c-type biogenesis protein
MTVTIGIAFLAGLASFLSPCIFPLIPVYISYISGRSVAASRGENQPGRVETLMHGLAFVLGFTIVFLFYGITVSALGGLLYNVRFILTKIGGILVVVFGLHMTGILRIPFLEYDLRPHTPVEKRYGYFSSVLMGIFFSAGWSPCLGPVLSSILALAANEGSILSGVKLLGAYSVGLAIPFLFAALGLGWVTFILRKYGKVLHYIEIITGVVLIIVGCLLFLGLFEQLAQYGFKINLGL